MDSGQWTAALYRRLSPNISLSRNPVDSTGEIWTKQCNFHAMKINHVEKESIAASIGLKPGDRLAPQIVSPLLVGAPDSIKNAFQKLIRKGMPTKSKNLMPNCSQNDPKMETNMHFVLTFWGIPDFYSYCSPSQAKSSFLRFRGEPLGIKMEPKCIKKRSQTMSKKKLAHKSQKLSQKGPKMSETF